MALGHSSGPKVPGKAVAFLIQALSLPLLLLAGMICSEENAKKNTGDFRDDIVRPPSHQHLRISDLLIK